MGSLRVHELAKQYNISSKDMLDKLRDLKIPAKSHASVLAEAYVDKVFKELGKPAGDGAENKTKKAPLTKEEKKAQKLEEEREKANREAVEKERAAREQERVLKTNDEEVNEDEESVDSDILLDDVLDDFIADNPYSSLEEQIANEKERARIEAEQAAKAKRAAENAKAVAKRQAVAEALKSRGDSKKQAAELSADDKQTAKPAPASDKDSDKFGALLSQIESEQKRISEQGKKQPAKKRGTTQASNEQIIPELEDSDDGEDRYAKMAVKAEKLQRDKVLADARAAVAAASNTEGEGRRKKRKEKREAEARERAEQQAISKGLDPTLVLDESVIEIPQGTTVGKLAELLHVQPNDIIKPLFLLGGVEHITK